MFLRKFLLALTIITVPVVFSFDIRDIIVNNCKAASDSFAAIEGKYAKLGERPPAKARFVGGQIKELQHKAYKREKLQRPFECIYNATIGSFIYLDDNGSYQDLVNECKSKKPKPNCDYGNPYRTLDGTCNNLDHPEWGAVLSCAQRLMKASYVGVSGFRKSVYNNEELPNARHVCTHYTTNLDKPRMLTSSHVPFFGQFLAHDIGDKAVSFIDDKPIDCCRFQYSKDQHPQCAEIDVPLGDSFYENRGISCLYFARSAPCPTCSLDKRIHMNEVTDFIDLSQVYGLTPKESDKLRKSDGSGKLKTQDSKSGDILPPNKEVPAFRCGKHLVSAEAGAGRKKRDLTSVFGQSVESKQEYCFKGGDRRVNQHTLLMLYHTIFVREHNRICDELKKYNPHWDEEKIYQEARKINIAQYQAIVYKEFLPNLIDKSRRDKYKLDVNDGAWTTYNSTLNPTIYSEFSTAAYRLHSIVDTKIGHTSLDDLREPLVRYTFKNHYPFYHDKIENLIQELGMRFHQEYDRFVIKDLTQYLYKERLGDNGFDLAAANIQRGRDHGLPPYVDVVKHLSDGKIDIKNFADLTIKIDQRNVELLQGIYRDARDIDLWIGLISEKKDPDRIVSDSAAEIIARQFRCLKFGDRFYFEHLGHFEKDQLKELLKATLSGIFCLNSKLQVIQKNSFEFPAPPSNSLVFCSDLPKVDLSKWKEEI